MWQSVLVAVSVMGGLGVIVGIGLAGDVDVHEAAEVLAEAVVRMRGDGAPPATGDDTGPVRLTRYTHGLGCACKLRPQDLEAVPPPLAPGHVFNRHV